MNRRVVAGGLVLAVVVAAAAVTSPGWAVDRLTWLAADPIRFAIALLVVAAVRPLLAWPTTLIAVAVGYGYGWAGVPFGVALLTLTALPPYWIGLAGRGGGTDRVTKTDHVARTDRVSRTGPVARAGERVERAGERVARAGDRIARAGERVVGATGGARAVAASRLLPTPSDAVSIAAGVAGVRLRPFLLGTAVGELPWVVAGVAVGISADRVLTGTGDLSALDPALFVGMAGLAALLLAGPAYRGYRARRAR